MKTLRTLGVTVVLGMLGAVLSLNCGGKSDGEAPPACVTPLAGACTSGQLCAQASTDCHGAASSVTCSCTNGGWTCPVVGPTDCAPPPVCMAYEGLSCSSLGAVCQSDQDCAYGGPNNPPTGGGVCTCDGHKFHCTELKCPVPPMCPDPSTIHEGGFCEGLLSSCASSDPILDCNGAVLGMQQCHCSDNSWICPAISPPCAVDGGGFKDAGGDPG